MLYSRLELHSILVDVGVVILVVAVTPKNVTISAAPGPAFVREVYGQTFRF